MTLVSSQPKPKTRLMDRLSLKVIALLLATFGCVFLVLLAYSFFVSTVEVKLAESNLPTQSVVEDIDPKIEQNLSKVVEAESDELETAAKDPFLDRGGISGLVKNSGTGFSTLNRFSNGQAPTSSTVSSVKSNSGANTGSIKSTSQPASNNSSAPGSAPVKPIELNTKDRLQIWKERARFGNMGAPSPSIFAITDLIPVGVVDGGNGDKEVMFFSESANKTFSFPIGTRFYDGWLINILDEGVVFSDGARVRPVTVLKSWGRGIRTGGSRSVSRTIKSNLPPLIDEKRTEGSRTNQAVLGGSN